MRNIKLVINNDLKKEKEKFFVKRELQCILNLYAKMVSNGSWKDYSFSYLRTKDNVEIDLIIERPSISKNDFLMRFSILCYLKSIFISNSPRLYHTRYPFKVTSIPFF